MDHLHNTTLFSSPLVCVTDVRCRAPEPACGPNEENLAPSLAIPRRGVFIKHIRSEELVGDANCAVFFNARESYRVSHPVPGGDDCTSFLFSEGVLRDAITRYDAVSEGELPRFPHTHGPLDSATFLGVQQLRARLLAGTADRIVVEEAALALLDSVLRQSYAARRIAPRPTRAGTQRVHRRWVENVQTLLNHRLGQCVSLADVAKEVHCSPFHLVRVFREHTGVPIHRYHGRLRLRLAIERMLQGQRDLTALALELDFSSHAHLSDAFRREFHCPPSALRAIGQG